MRVYNVLATWVRIVVKEWEAKGVIQLVLDDSGIIRKWNTTGSLVITEEMIGVIRVQPWYKLDSYVQFEFQDRNSSSASPVT